MTRTAAISSLTDINSRILTLRNQKVILDSDLTCIYGTEVRALLQAVKRNSDRFPLEFVFQLAPEELALLRSQTVISKAGRGGRRYLPYAFTEHGALMAATVLNSPQAVKMSLFIIRAFVKMRENLAANATILKRLAEIDKTLLLQDGALRDIYQKLRPLLEAPPTPPKPEIGFHVKEDATPYRIKRKTTRPSGTTSARR